MLTDDQIPMPGETEMKITILCIAIGEYRVFIFTVLVSIFFLSRNSAYQQFFPNAIKVKITVLAI